jgi:pimeloyl-ACP methyl ester carboxylesterase
MLDLLSGVTSHDIQPDRLRMHYLSYRPEDGIPVLLIHGNLATGRFFEHLMPNAPDGYRFLMPDMRGFGDTERVRVARNPKPEGLGRIRRKYREPRIRRTASQQRSVRRIFFGFLGS